MQKTEYKVSISPVLFYFFFFIDPGLLLTRDYYPSRSLATVNDSRERNPRNLDENKNTVMVVRYYVVKLFPFRLGLYDTGSRRGQMLDGVLDNETSCLCHTLHHMLVKFWRIS